MNTERQSKILLLLIMIQHTLRGQDYWLGAPGSGFNEVTALVAIPLVATCCLLLWRNVSNQDERCRIAVHILAVSVLKSGIVCDTSCFSVKRWPFSSSSSAARSIILLDVGGMPLILASGLNLVESYSRRIIAKQDNCSFGQYFRMM